ncbi:hypothetical protein [Flavobacterium sp.]|uniref:hypothetical protein n=1 Tax=Flavobacterium sp. TaxID=239 RepID=UPI0037C1546E
MEKVKIEILPEVIIFLNELIELLFYKEYFGFEDTAQLYVQKIYDFFEYDLLNFPHKSTPIKLKKFGSNYVFFRPNNRTTWYIFFEKNNNRYLITHLTNNHIKELNDL